MEEISFSQILVTFIYVVIDDVHLYPRVFKIEIFFFIHSVRLSMEIIMLRSI